MLLVATDVETTGLDVTKDKIIEVGAVLWDTVKLAPIRVFNSLVVYPDLQVSAEIEAITGINSQMLVDYGEPPSEVFNGLSRFLACGDYIVAHNGNAFDRPLIERHFLEFGCISPDRLWLDTTIDVEYPKSITTRKLVHLAAEHGFVNPFAHRAIFDVLTMLKVLSCYDLARVIELAKEPSVTVQAVVSFADKEKAKERGFRWDGDKKAWKKTMKRSQLVEATKETPFKMVEVG